MNKVRQHQQVVYDSDVFDASGTSIDSKYLALRQPGAQWSEWKFGKQFIMPAKFKLWQEALEQLAPTWEEASAPGRVHLD